MGPTSQSAPPARSGVVPGPHGDQGHGIGGVRGVGTAGLGIDHQLAVPVVGRDQHRGSGGFRGRQDPAQALVHGFHRLDDRREYAGMSDHVGVGKVAEA